MRNLQFLWWWRISLSAESETEGQSRRKSHVRIHQSSSVVIGKKKKKSNETNWKPLPPYSLGSEEAQQLLAKWHLMKAGLVQSGGSRVQRNSDRCWGKTKEQQATLHQPTPLHVISLICSTCLLRLPNVNLKLQLHCWPSHWTNYFWRN